MSTRQQLWYIDCFTTSVQPSETFFLQNELFCFGWLVEAVQRMEIGVQRMEKAVRTGPVRTKSIFFFRTYFFLVFWPSDRPTVRAPSRPPSYTFKMLEWWQHMETFGSGFGPWVKLLQYCLISWCFGGWCMPWTCHTLPQFNLDIESSTMEYIWVFVGDRYAALAVSRFRTWNAFDATMFVYIVTVKPLLQTIVWNSDDITTQLVLAL